MNDRVALTETHVDLPLFSRGKVRDSYQLDADRLLMVTTDRISAFDFVLPTGIPDRGTVLTQLSLFWFARTGDVVENHLLGDSYDGLPAELRGRAMVVRRAQRIDFECVVRGYLAGSAWAEYREQGTMAGEPLPAGLRESERLPEPLFTPATKADTGHDENVTFDRLRSDVGEELASRLRDASLRLYSEAGAHAERQGLILADTKFEFGFDDAHVLTLIDEALTPDSSRYWDAARWRPGETPASYDKQFVRDFLLAQGWDREPPAPVLPGDVVAGTAMRYRECYQKLTGRDVST